MNTDEKYYQFYETNILAFDNVSFLYNLEKYPHCLCYPHWSKGGLINGLKGDVITMWEDNGPFITKILPVTGPIELISIYEMSLVVWEDMCELKHVLPIL